MDYDMKKIILITVLISLYLSSVGQIANRMIYTQNFIQDVNPANVVFTVPPNDNRFWVADRNSLRFNYNQILNLTDSIHGLGDVRYKAIAWLPDWSTDILGVPSVFPSNIANVSGLQATLDGKQPAGSYLTSISSSDVTTALGYTPYSNANPNNYISSITSSDVSTALGFTPYSNSNPNGYISSISSSDVTTALGFTPYNATNPSSYISRSGVSAGTGISYNSSTGVITNSSPDQTVSLTGGTDISIIGSYPSFTVSYSGIRQETYSGTTNASGVYTITFTDPYDTAPNIQASITNQSSTNQFIRVSSVSTTGFTINVYQRNSASVLGIEVLLAAVVNVNGATVDVLVTEK